MMKNSPERKNTAIIRAAMRVNSNSVFSRFCESGASLVELSLIFVASVDTKDIPYFIKSTQIQEVKHNFVGDFIMFIRRLQTSQERIVHTGLDMSLQHSPLDEWLEFTDSVDRYSSTKNRGKILIKEKARNSRRSNIT